MAPLGTSPARRRLRRLALLAVAWGMMTGGVFSGCRGLFKPAIPEPPSGRPIVINYRSPEATLATMELGIGAKAQGEAAWLGAFADSTSPDDSPAYHQIFDPADLLSCQCENPGDWRVTQEQIFFFDFLDVRSGEEYAAIFDSVDATPDQPPGDTEAIVHRHYRVFANAPDGNSTRIIAIGYADLIFTKFSGDRWLITRWEDHVDPDVGVNPSAPHEYELTLGRRRLDSTR